MSNNPPFYLNNPFESLTIKIIYRIIETDILLITQSIKAVQQRIFPREVYYGNIFWLLFRVKKNSPVFNRWLRVVQSLLQSLKRNIMLPSCFSPSIFAAVCIMQVNAIMEKKRKEKANVQSCVCISLCFFCVLRVDDPR